jgi:hypothetical protein
VLAKQWILYQNRWSSVTCYLQSAKTVVQTCAATQRTVKSTQSAEHCQVMAANWHSSELNCSAINQPINQLINHKHMKYTIKQDTLISHNTLLHVSVYTNPHQAHHITI